MSFLKKMLKGQSRTREVIYSPVAGAIVQLKDVKDPVFADEMMGKGIAIFPEVGRVVSPVIGRVETVFPTKHAVGLKSDIGASVIIHIGLDTVELKGQHFTTHVEVGDQIEVGDVLVTFDKEEILAAGYEVVTPVVVTNSVEYQEVDPTGVEVVSEGEELIHLTN